MGGGRGDWTVVRSRRGKAVEQVDGQRDRLREDQRHGGAWEEEQRQSRVRVRYNSVVRFGSQVRFRDAEDLRYYHEPRISDDGRTILQYSRSGSSRDVGDRRINQNGRSISRQGRIGAGAANIRGEARDTHNSNRHGAARDFNNNNHGGARDSSADNRQGVVRDSTSAINHGAVRGCGATRNTGVGRSKSRPRAQDFPEIHDDAHDTHTGNKHGDASDFIANNQGGACDSSVVNRQADVRASTDANNPGIGRGHGANRNTIAGRSKSRPRAQDIPEQSGIASSKFVSFYFTNVPEDISYRYLREGFEVCGMMEDVYLARKRNVNGGVFGFVRYANVEDIEKLLKSLNNVRFGDWKVVAKVASFDRFGNSRTVVRDHGEGEKIKRGVNIQEGEKRIEGEKSKVGGGNMDEGVSGSKARVREDGGNVVKGVVSKVLEVVSVVDVEKKNGMGDRGNQVFVPKYFSSADDVSWATKGVVVSVLNGEAIPV